MTEKWSRAVLRGLGSREAPRLPDHVQQHRVGKTHTGKMGGPNSFPLGFKTHITPSKEALHRHLEAIGHVMKQRKAQDQKNMIGPLNLIIRGWSNYYSRCMASETFGK